MLDWDKPAEERALEAEAATPDTDDSDLNYRSNRPPKQIFKRLVSQFMPGRSKMAAISERSSEHDAASEPSDLHEYEVADG